MIKSALKTYRNNIWNIFAVTGIVAIGVLVALIVVAPVLYDLLYFNITRVMSAALAIPESGFSAEAFLEAIMRQLRGLNWQDPISSIQSMLDPQALIHFFKIALEGSGMQFWVIDELMGTINQCVNEIVAGVKDQLIFVLTCVGTSCALAFVASRAVIQATSVRNKSVWRFIVTFLLNLLTIALGYGGIILCLFSLLPIIGFIFIALGILLVVWFLTFLWAAIFYRQENVKFTEIFNFKTFLWYILASLIVLAISAAVVVIAFLISDVIGLIIALPLIFVTNIIMENIILAYTTNYNDIFYKNKIERPRKHLKKKSK